MLVFWVKYILEFSESLAPLQGLNTYFNNISTAQGTAGTHWANDNTQAKLNADLIATLATLDPDANDQFVTEVAFAAVEGTVALCLEDWPKAAGSVWTICKALWKKFFNTGIEEEVSAVLQNYPNYPNVTDQQLQNIRQAVITRITNKINDSGAIVPRVDGIEDVIITLTTEINGLKQRVQALENNH